MKIERTKESEWLVSLDPDRWDSDPYLSTSIRAIRAIRGYRFPPEEGKDEV